MGEGEGWEKRGRGREKERRREDEGGREGEGKREACMEGEGTTGLVHCTVEVQVFKTYAVAQGRPIFYFTTNNIPHTFPS